MEKNVDQLILEIDSKIAEERKERGFFSFGSSSGIRVSNLVKLKQIIITLYSYRDSVPKGIKYNELKSYLLDSLKLKEDKKIKNPDQDKQERAKLKYLLRMLSSEEQNARDISSLVKEVKRKHIRNVLLGEYKRSLNNESFDENRFDRYLNHFIESQRVDLNENLEDIKVQFNNSISSIQGHNTLKKENQPKSNEELTTAHIIHSLAIQVEKYNQLPVLTEKLDFDSKAEYLYNSIENLDTDTLNKLKSKQKVDLTEVLTAIEAQRQELLAQDQEVLPEATTAVDLREGNGKTASAAEAQGKSFDNSRKSNVTNTNVETEQTFNYQHLHDKVEQLVALFSAANGVYTENFAFQNKTSESLQKAIEELKEFQNKALELRVKIATLQQQDGYNAEFYSAYRTSEGLDATIPDVSKLYEEIFNFYFQSVAEQKTVKIRYPEGHRYEGEVNEEGLPHGKGVFYVSNTETLSGSFQNGKFHGDVINTKDGKERTVTYHEGQIISLGERNSGADTEETVFEFNVFSRKILQGIDTNTYFLRNSNEEYQASYYREVASDSKNFLDLTAQFLNTNGAAINNAENPVFKLTVNQHGGENGINDLGIDEACAKEFYLLLEKKGFAKCIVDSHSCHLGEAKAFIEVAKIGEHPFDITIHSVPETSKHLSIPTKDLQLECVIPGLKSELGFIYHGGEVHKYPASNQNIADDQSLSGFTTTSMEPQTGAEVQKTQGNLGVGAAPPELPQSANNIETKEEQKAQEEIYNTTSDVPAKESNQRPKDSKNSPLAVVQETPQTLQQAFDVSPKNGDYEKLLGALGIDSSNEGFKNIKGLFKKAIGVQRPGVSNRNDEAWERAKNDAALRFFEENSEKNPHQVKKDIGVSMESQRKSSKPSGNKIGWASVAASTVLSFVAGPAVGFVAVGAGVGYWGFGKYRSKQQKKEINANFAESLGENSQQVADNTPTQPNPDQGQQEDQTNINQLLDQLGFETGEGVSHNPVALNYAVAKLYKDVKGFKKLEQRSKNISPEKAEQYAGFIVTELSKDSNNKESWKNIIKENYQKRVEKLERSQSNSGGVVEGVAYTALSFVPGADAALNMFGLASTASSMANQDSNQNYDPELRDKGLENQQNVDLNGFTNPIEQANPREPKPKHKKLSVSSNSGNLEENYSGQQIKL